MAEAAMNTIDALALAGNRFGEIDVACPSCGPFCKRAVNRKRKVLRIWRHDPGFASFYCARCGEHGFSREEGLTSKVDPAALARRAAAERREAEETKRRQANALDIFHDALPIEATRGESYLIKRGVDIGQLPDEMERVLRFHPRCPWERGTAPCMVALWTDAITGEPKAIHRTAIGPQLERIDRMSFGPTAGCVIRLWPDEWVEQGLVLGEGIETVLWAATRVDYLATLLQPAWAAGDRGHIRAFPVLPGIDALTLLVDHDANGAGQRDAAECTRRWRAAGREVIPLMTNEIGTDFADLAGEIAS
jgi:hypothetical protein